MPGANDTRRVELLPILSNRAQPKTAFVFAGGGSFGVIQVGMLHALAAHGIVADVVFGSLIARDVARLCHRHALPWKFGKRPGRGPKNRAPHPLPRGLSRHGQIVDRRTGKSSIRHRQGRTSVC